MNNKFTAIILSYKRPWNIQTICQTILGIERISKLVISNNNPEVDIENFISLSDDRLMVINQSDHQKCIKRFEIAFSESSSFFLSIDDDLFLSKLQIEYLMMMVESDPSRPHGCWGQLMTAKGDDISLASDLNENMNIDVLNRAYFFTHEHVTSLFSLMEKLQINVQNIGPCDDIYLSFSGQNKPRIHKIGWFEECHTSNEIGIALWRSKDFAQDRVNMIKRILKVKRY